MDAASRDAWSAARPGDPPFDTACVAPWVSIEFDPAGWVYACCTSQLYPLGRIGRERLKDLWGGPRAAVLKDALRRWDLSVACQPCRFHLEHGRMDPAAAVYDQYPVHEDDPARPHMMLFALSNRCNLGCIMCSPALSSTLQREAGIPSVPSPYDDEFFADLEPMLEGLELAKFLGGEPFLAPEHRRIWTMLDALTQPPKLSVTTNGTVWTDTVDWLLDRFEVDISVSIDAATPPTYAAIRRGGDLAVVHANMDRFAERCAARGTNLHVSYCLMPQNAHELGRFLVWAEQYTFGAPAYVNLVTDEGMALHDLDTVVLERIRAAWAAEDRAVTAQLDRNAQTWRTQLDQLDDVLADRRAGRRTVATRAHPLPPDPLGPLRQDPVRLPRHRSRRHARRARDVHRDRVAAWSGGHLAELRSDSDGRVTEVPIELERLGIVSRRVLGLPVTDLLLVIAGADGRPVHLLDHAELDDHTARTFVLSHQAPARGVSGSVVRVVELRIEGGWTHFVGIDSTYDDAIADPSEAQPTTSTPVALTPRNT